MNKELFDFLKELKVNNNKEWFDLNRKRYELLRSNFIEHIQLLINEIAKFDKSVSNLDAKKTIFRINRDIRFSKDKRPYKTNFGAYINGNGKKSAHAGYYIHFEPEGTFIAGGMWQPESLILSKIRQEIDYNSKDFLSIVESKKIIEYFGGMQKTDILKTMPKGYDVSLKYSEYLRLKSFVLVKNYTQKQVFDKDFIKKTAVDFKVIYPFNNFLNRVLDDQNE
jgi:uncharacterized protein (TIGR02453 family)